MDDNVTTKSQVNDHMNIEKSSSGTGRHKNHFDQIRFYWADMKVRHYFASSLSILKHSWKFVLIYGIILYTVLSQILNPGKDIFAGIQDMLSFEDLSIPGNLQEFISFLLLSFITLSLTIIAHKASEGYSIRIKENIRIALQIYGRYLLTSIVYFVGQIVCAIPLLLFLFYLAGQSLEMKSDAMASLILLIFGSILLFIPVIIWLSKFVFAPFAIIIEESTIINAFKRSAFLSKNNVFKVAFSETIVGICYYLFIVIIPYFIVKGKVISMLMKLYVPYSVSDTIIMSFLQIIWSGLFIIFNVLFYKSLLAKFESLSNKAIDQCDSN